MISDPALRTPQRYAWLALLLVVPSLGLAWLAVRAVRLDRRAAEAELAERTTEIATRALARVTNLLVLHGTLPAPGVFDDRIDDILLHLDADHELLWPKRGVWPPVPRTERLADSDGVGESRALTRLRNAHALRDQGQREAAVEAYRQALAQGGAEAWAESGVSVGAVALHALLDLVDGRLDSLPETWRTGPRGGLAEALALDATPLSHAALARLEELLTAQKAKLPSDRSRAEVAAAFRQRKLVLQAYEALAETRVRRLSSTARSNVALRPWRDAMSFQIEREVWLALRVDAFDGVESRADASESTFVVRRWHDVIEGLRQALREADPQGSYGFAIQLQGPDFRMDQEEPSGVAARASGRASADLLGGALRVSTAAALLDPEAHAAPQRRRERSMAVVIAGSVGVSGMAAWFAWRLLARQHRLNVEKSNFVAAVSHELRAPLASIRLLADNLEQGRVPEEERRMTTLRLIGRECRRLGVLVDNVLDLSRIERGKRKLEREPTGIATLVRETVRWASIAGEERGVGLRLEIDPGAEELVALVDGGALRQALANLLDNAFKHAPARSEVEVALALPPRSTEFRLAVTDHGPGIPPAERERIFEPFHRLGRELRREQPGIGIGLALVRHTVLAHGGRLRVEDVQPSGARFVLQIPIGTIEGVATEASRA